MRINRQKPYTPGLRDCTGVYQCDTWTAYEAFNDNLLDPDKNIL